jgi:hypothetical protein
MLKEFIDEHNEKATRKANKFIKDKKLEVKNFTAFADNLAKTHLIIEFEESKEEAPVEAPVPKKTATKTVTKKTTSKASTATK